MKLIEALEIYGKFISLELKPVTAERAIMDARLMCVYFHNPELEEIKDHQIIKYLEMMRECGYMHNSIAKKALNLRSIWKFFNKKEYRTFKYDLIPNMRMEATLPKVATEEEFRKVLSVIPFAKYKYCRLRDDCLVRLLWDTGARNGELVSLKVEDLDLVSMKAVIRTEKSRGMRPFREVYWTQETNESLDRWLAFKEEMEKGEVIAQPEYLFWGCTNAGRGMRLSTVAVAAQLRKYCRKAKIRCVNPHSFRHHMGHDLAMQGANNSTISSILGHSDLSSSFVYTELNNGEREIAYNKYKRKA